MSNADIAPEQEPADEGKVSVAVAKVVEVEESEEQEETFQNDHVERTMHAIFGLNQSILMVAMVLLNFALLIVSHTGVNLNVFSSDFSGGSDTPDQDTKDLCNEEDIALWYGNSSSPIPEDRCKFWNQVTELNGRACPYATETEIRLVHPDYMAMLGVGIVRNRFDPDVLVDPFPIILERAFGFSNECSTCMKEVSSCTTRNCFIQAIPGLTSQGCNTTDTLPLRECVAANCNSRFEECTGLKLPLEEEFPFVNCPRKAEEGRVLQGTEVEETCFDVESLNIQMNSVFNITFGNAIQKSIEGDAYLIAILILVASGVWPYVKNIVMMYVWFMPISGPRRDSTLLWLARFGRWSLVDVFAVILILVGLRIDKIAVSTVVVRSMSSTAIYCFVAAALLAILQGEYIRMLNRSAHRHSKDLSKILPVQALDKADRGNIQGFGAAAALLAAGALVGGLMLPTIDFTLSGVLENFEGRNFIEYTGLDVGASLTDECQLGNAGEYVLVVTFFATVVVLPLIGFVCYVILFMAPGFLMEKHRGFVRFTNIVSNFACLDVFAVSMFVVIVQFKPLIDSAFKEQVSGLCSDDSEDCITFTGSLRTGAFLIATSAVFLWCTQYLAILAQKYWRYRAIESMKLAREPAAYY
mmetsp:Transcript_10009/g.17558  ORF Transcript_10009/g.17558 Transcript_10009/m.17558 type:complete len:640 (+) Transcript_10009:261-2180(+)